MNPSLDLNLPADPIPDRVSIVSLIEPGERKVLAELDGPGCIRRISCVLRHPKLLPMANRKIIIRIYFDDHDTPHVEAPVGDFFGVMHGEPYYDINSAFLSVKAWNGYNCFFPMPFARSARIEFNAGVEQNQVYLQADWSRYPHAALEEPMRFCCRWRRENPTERYDHDYLLLDADGPGRLIGFAYGLRLIDNVDRWSHGGGDNIYVDGGGDRPAYLRGVGGEDVFGVGFGGNLHPVDSHLYEGMPYYTHEDVGEARPAPRVVGYRWFVPDEVCFRESLHLRFGCMRNDICSTAYWLQAGAVRPFFTMPSWEGLVPGSELPGGTHDLPLPDDGVWQLCGPFDLRDGAAMNETLPPESAFQPQQAYDAGHPGDSPYRNERSRELGRDQAHWVRYPSLRGFVDFNHVFRAAIRGAALTHPAAAVARCTLVSPGVMKARVRLAWDDHLVLRVNGEPHDLGEHKAFRPCEIDINLRAGANDLTVKLSNTFGSTHGGWAFAFSALAPDGAPLKPQEPASNL